MNFHDKSRDGNVPMMSEPNFNTTNEQNRNLGEFNTYAKSIILFQDIRSEVAVFRMETRKPENSILQATTHRMQGYKTHNHKGKSQVTYLGITGNIPYK